MTEIDSEGFRCHLVFLPLQVLIQTNQVGAADEAESPEFDMPFGISNGHGFRDQCLSSQLPAVHTCAIKEGLGDVQ